MRMPEKCRKHNSSSSNKYNNNNSDSSLTCRRTDGDKKKRGQMPRARLPDFLFHSPAPKMPLSEVRKRKSFFFSFFFVVVVFLSPSWAEAAKKRLSVTSFSWSTIVGRYSRRQKKTDRNPQSSSFIGGSLSNVAGFILRPLLEWRKNNG